MAESWTATALLAPVTSRIRMLVAIRPGCFNPGSSAKMISTLDEASGGRLALNMVAGGTPADMFGRPMDHEARYRRLAEYVTCLKRLWTQDTVDFKGEFFELNGAYANPKPVQKPHPPLYLGGASEAAKQLAARDMHTYLMWGEPMDQVRRRIEGMQQLASSHSRTLRYGLRIHLIVGRSYEDARRLTGELLSHADARVMAQRRAEFDGFDSSGQARMLAIEAGDGDWVTEHLWAGIRRVRGGAGTALVGTAEQVAEQLGRYVECGIGMFILSGYPHREEAARVGEEVLPLVRQRHGIQRSGATKNLLVPHGK
jgi:alkanesulfonate monooxygenase